MDHTENIRVWFQMTRPGDREVNLKIRVFEDGQPAFEENIRETIHDPAAICALLEGCGLRVIKCADKLPDEGEYHGTTWFVIAQK